MELDPEYFNNLKIRALARVLDPDFPAMLRQIFRTYSEKFHTPLYQVEELPLEHVLQAYFESTFESIKHEKEGDIILRREARNLTETDEERNTRILEEEEMALADDEYVRELEAEEKARQAKFRQDPLMTMPEKTSDMTRAIHKVGEAIQQAADWNPIPPQATNVLSSLPDISMKYDDIADNPMFDLPSVVAPPKKRP